MSEVNKINLNDTLFDIEDTVARENITTMQANIANDLDACSLVEEEDKSIAGAYAVQQLNRSLVWKLAGNTNGQGTLDLSNIDFSELYIKIASRDLSSYDNEFDLVISKVGLSSTDRRSYFGYYNANNPIYGYVKLSINSVNLGGFQFGTSNVTSSFGLDVYYR